MAKTRASADQIAFVFDAPQPATSPAALAGSDVQTARMVAEALKGEDRVKIAAKMTLLMDEDISKGMLDAYASPARDGHNISFHRMLALIAVTNRFDLLDNALRAIGAAVLVGDEIYTAEIGHIDSEISKLQQRRKDLSRLHPTITRNRRK
ncbi:MULTISPECIES: hypothetical protein [unclassified Sphingobium]|uniref:hypothetical protein n=1 Tax=unclassified Sphingobium TaxID=2611147 RepID=UPI0035A6DA51